MRLRGCTEMHEKLTLMTQYHAQSAPFNDKQQGLDLAGGIARQNTVNLHSCVSSSINLSLMEQNALVSLFNQNQSKSRANLPVLHPEIVHWNNMQPDMGRQHRQLRLWTACTEGAG